MSEGIERRRAPRHTTMGVLARSVSPNSERLWDVADLSVLGALIVGDEPIAEGEARVFEFQVPGETPVCLTARVARCMKRDGRYHAGLQFLSVTTEAEDFVHDTILAELIRARRRMVLAVARDVSTAIDLWSDLDEIGCDARVAASLIEARDALYARDLPVSTVLVDVRAGLDDEARRFIAHVVERFPAARCVVLGGADPGIDGAQWFGEDRWATRERAMLFAPERRFDPAAAVQ